MSTHAQQATRAREKPASEEEAASTLKLGEFQDVPCLTLSEARLLINVVIEHRKQGSMIREGEIFNKTNDYLDIFARFKAKENIEAVEQLLASKVELQYFERAQLGSLCCDTAEEAKMLIPSLANKISDADLQELLEDITRLRIADQ